MLCDEAEVRRSREVRRICSPDRGFGKEMAIRMIEICHLTKLCDNRQGIRNVSMHIEGKGVHGIFGQKGAGKTVLMDLLGGCMLPDSGVVRIDGNDSDMTHLKHKIGYVSQKLPLYTDMTAVEILNFCGEAKKVPPEKLSRQVKEALELTGMDSKAHTQIASLGRGEKRRVRLAQALLGNPMMILLDEPFYGLNESDQKDLREIVRMLGRMKPVFLATSSSEEIYALCHDALILSEGEVLYFEPVECLKQRLEHEAILKISANGNAEKMKARILELEHVLSCRILESDDNGNCTLSIRYRSGSDTRNAIVSSCEAEDGMVRSLENQRPSLAELSGGKEEMLSKDQTVSGASDVPDRGEKEVHS